MPKTTSVTITPEFSTFVSLNRGLVRDIEYDSAGNIYVTGGGAQIDVNVITPGNDFKVLGGTVDHGRLAPHDVFVQKYAPDGSLIWTTRIGGENYDRAYALEVDNQGSVYVAGRAGLDFYTTPGALQETFGGDDPATENTAYGPQDGFVSKLDADTGQVTWSTYFGGASGELIRDIDVGPDGTIHIAQTFVKLESGQHITADALQPNLNGGVDDIYAQLSNDGSTLLYGTYIGGDNEPNPTGGNPAVIVDANGDINFLTETDAFNAPTTPGAYSAQPLGEADLYMVKFDGADGGRSIKAATYFGTSGLEILETHDLAVDDAGNFIVVGETKGLDLETGRKSYQAEFGGGNTDGFVAKISADGTQVLAATYFGGDGRDNVEGVVLKADGIYVTGMTSSTNLAVTDGGSFSGATDAFVVRFSTDLQSADYVSYVGGTDDDHGRAIAVSDSGQVTLGGTTFSADYPILNPADGSFWGPNNPMLTSFTISSGSGGGTGGGGGGKGGGSGSGGGGGGKGGGKGPKSASVTTAEQLDAQSVSFGGGKKSGFSDTDHASGYNFQGPFGDDADLADWIAMHALGGGHEFTGASSSAPDHGLYMVIADEDGDGVYTLQLDDIWSA